MQIYIDESGNIVSSLKAPCFVVAALATTSDLAVRLRIKYSDLYINVNNRLNMKWLP